MSCGAHEGGVRLEDAPDLGSQAVIAGAVRSGDQPAHPAYVRLLDASGEFAAEVPTGSAGEFRFYAAPGGWTVRALVPGRSAVEQQVTAERGRIAELVLQA